MSNWLTFVMLATVVLILARDWGHRRVTLFALWRPLVISVVVIPLVMPGWNFSGNGLLLEAGAILAGAAIGVLTGAFMKVSVDASGQKWTDAGVPYAAIWIVLAAARSAFIYGCTHWFEDSLGTFLMSNHISTNAFGGAVMFLSLVPVVVNRLLIMARGGGARPVPRPVPGASVAA